MSSLQTRPKDECFISTPIENYAQMKIMFDKRGLLNPLAVDTLQLALQHLIDHADKRDAYLAGTKEQRKR